MVAFLKGIPQDVLARASLRSKAYTRALMHFETHILESKESVQDHLTFLQVRHGLPHTRRDGCTRSPPVSADAFILKG